MSTLTSRLTKHFNSRTGKHRYSLNWTDVPASLTAHMQTYKVVGKNLFVVKATPLPTGMENMTLSQAAKQFGADFKVGNLTPKKKTTETLVAATPMQAAAYSAARFKLDSWILTQLEKKTLRDIDHWQKRIVAAQKECDTCKRQKDLALVKLAEIQDKIASHVVVSIG